MATVVLLGAGASYGSIDVKQPHKPPLGNCLFKQLEQRGGIAAELPQELKKIFRDDFEKGMAAYYEYAEGDIMHFQRELAYYLAQFEPGLNNIYIKLIAELGIHQIIYSSLNYDLLFELSAAALGLNTIYSTENQLGYVRLLKLHGSSNFWPAMAGTSFPGSTFKGSGASADIIAPIVPRNRAETIQMCLAEGSTAPAIAVYAEGKPVRISPDYVENQQKQWIDSVNRANKVFVVGVRVHQIDKHIWGTLGKCKADVTYFGFPTDEKEFSEWKETWEKQNAFFQNADFVQSIPIIKHILNKSS